MRKILRRLKTVALILKARREISRLYGEPNISSRAVACALKDTIANKIAPEEKSWIDRIESLRKELNSSSTEISVVDYGAGSPDAKLTEEEMYEGRIGTRTIGDVCRQASQQ